MTQSLGRARLSMLIVGVLLGACGDDGDSSSNEQAQSADAGSSTTRPSSPRAGRGGNAANNSASAGRSGAAGQQVSSAAGRSGVSAGAAAPSGGSGGTKGVAGANAPVPDAGTRQIDDQDAGGPVRMRLTDAQIAAVLSAANTAETGVGAYAVMHAVSPAVRQFAQSMVEMHGVAQERQTALFNMLNLTLSTTALSAQLTDQSTVTMTQLQSLSDSEFDAAYMRSQVEAHMQVLMIIDEQLLPNVIADALRAEIVLTRSQVAMHMDSARAALQILEAELDAGVVMP